MKDKKTWVVFTVAIVLVAAISFAGVAYAMFSDNLNINGSATVKAPSWKVKFAELQPVSLGGSAREISQPQMDDDDTTIKDYSVSLVAPGDSVSYTFDVVNEGSIDAEISSFNLPKTLQCTGNGAEATTDQEKVCKNLTYTLKYQDDEENVKSGDTLTSGQSRTVVLTLKYADNIEEANLPKDDVTISGLNIAIVYKQAD